MVVLVPVVQCLSGEQLAEWDSQDRGQLVPEYGRRHDDPARSRKSVFGSDLDLETESGPLTLDRKSLNKVDLKRPDA
jgi:hypothetical protein